ncbi:unnamed protein product [Cuscuta epithymum]|uniref:Uncharacterized protein n=1 Tax=Cuscuta epithymum TaxID=186058 RepID=A0AAV0CRI0_9ASTE|nr:unnamed protein product [Cuscuta epithymum]
MTDFKAWQVRKALCMKIPLVIAAIMTVSAIAVVASARKDMPSFSPSPQNNEHRQGNVEELPLRQMEEDYYGAWDPAPFFGGSYPAPVPHGIMGRTRRRKFIVVPRPPPS